MTIEEFIQRWQSSGAAERANYVSFLNELCDLLEVPRPDPALPDDEQNAYVFERAVTFQNGDGTTSQGRIDLYKRSCFVLEAKQGSERNKDGSNLFGEKPKKTRKGTATRGTKRWDDAMLAARGQAENYARALPQSEGWPPFIIVVDVGYSIELFSDFSRSGRTYIPFPDARSHRIFIKDLAGEELRERLKLVWTDPLSLDPSRRSARITREVAAQLAALAKSLEDSGHSPERVASFLMRCIFTMFAEDVKLIPERGFTDLLKRLRHRLDVFSATLESLWTSMNEGGFSPLLMENLLRFNGGLFETAEAVDVDEDQLELLIRASEAYWKDVEPAIFGTLLERALDPIERHKLGAHYTPRAYVERLVMPTIIEPLREDWESAQAAAVTLAKAGRIDEAIQEVKAFHRRLCDTRILDPACGTGNFLYVTLEHMKRLEGEVLDTLEGFGEKQTRFEIEGLTVDPHQLLGIEKNARAVAIADLVLWIGYLQWHFRTRGDAKPHEPVIKKFRNIEWRDAVLAYDREEEVTDESGQAVTRWDGRTYKKHVVTGEDVPDETARVPLYRYVNARKAQWPEADFIIGNPPFIGARRIRQSLGDEYVEELRRIYPEVPETCDYVMYWWHKAATLVGQGRTKRFGFITTNSIVQSYSRGLIEQHLMAEQGVVIIFAIPDHPWVESADGASVRVAMTVAASKETYSGSTILAQVVRESGRADMVILDHKRVASISAALRSDFQPENIEALQSNKDMCFQGVVPSGEGFRLDGGVVKELGYSYDNLPSVIKPYIIGRDVVQTHHPKFIIDFFGLSESEAREQWPLLYQHIFDRVYPERRQNKRAAYRDKWWIFAEPRPAMRRAFDGLNRLIVTPNTAKHRSFIFVNEEVLPDTTVYAIASDDAFLLGVLSSCIHVTWALLAGGTLEDRPRYNSKGTFMPFPFPACDESHKAKIRELGESLDAHRKRQQAQHPRLTITDMYNVLEKLRAEEPLTDKDKIIHEQGLISILKQIHDELDLAVSEAYGWPAQIPDEEILERLVALNTKRASEERAGTIRWLRPDFQNPQRATQAALETAHEKAASASARQEKTEWPATLAEQARAVRNALAAQSAPATAAQLAKSFKGGKGRAARIGELLETLVSLGQAREVETGRFVS